MDRKTIAITGLVAAGVVLCGVASCIVLGKSSPKPADTASSGSTTTVTFSLDGFCVDGCPTGIPASDHKIVRHIYVLESNPKTKFADWVAYKITKDTLGSGCKRKWEKDPDLSDDETLSPSDYKDVSRNHMDRGHQAPLASLCGSPNAEEANYLSNITPQSKDLNEGPWEHLENAERDIINNQNATIVYSLTGPLYERDMPPLPNTSREERTPSGYWKIVSYTKGQQIYAAAFVMDQSMGREDDYCATVIEISKLQARTKYNYFPNYPRQNGFSGFHQNDMFHQLGCN